MTYQLFIYISTPFNPHDTGAAQTMGRLAFQALYLLAPETGFREVARGGRCAESA